MKDLGALRVYSSLPCEPIPAGTYSLKRLNMPKLLVDRTGIVTGAAHGIGEAIARRLASDGASVVVNYTGNAKEADEVVAAIQRSQGKAIAVQADVSKPEQIEKMFDSAEEAFGPVSLLVNNAALRGTMTPAAELQIEQMEEIFRTNVFGPALCMGAFARRLRNADGNIVNISSGQARIALPGASLYSGTKGALESLTRVFAADLGPKKIRVNAVAPGATGTDQFLAAISDKAKQETIENTALGRIGLPADIADVVAFLLSPDAHWVTGQVLDVNGGLRRS